MHETHQSIVIEKPVAHIWQKISNFHDMSWAPKVISSVEKVGDIDGDETGAKRILNNTIHETLVAIDDDGFTIIYTIDDGPSPLSQTEISNYFGNIKLSPIDENQTHVAWSSSWESSSDSAVEFCQKVYFALLNELNDSCCKANQ